MYETAKEEFRQAVEKYIKRIHSPFEVKTSEIVTDKKFSDMLVGDYVVVPDMGEDCNAYYVEYLSDKMAVVIPMFYKQDDSGNIFDRETLISASLQDKKALKHHHDHHYYMMVNYIFIAFPTRNWGELQKLIAELESRGDDADFRYYLDFDKTAKGADSKDVDLSANCFLAHTYSAEYQNQTTMYNGLHCTGRLSYGKNKIVLNKC